jgi:FHA domain/Double zinc ribbon
MIVCPNCNHPNPDGAVQCEACYTPLPVLLPCPNCGASVQADASFCGQCGFNLQGAAAPTSSKSPDSTVPNNLPDQASANAPTPSVPEIAPLEPLMAPDPLMFPAEPAAVEAAESAPGLSIESPESPAQEPISSSSPQGSAPAPSPPLAPSTQLQTQTARLLHVQTNLTLELPTNLAVIHIGKPNDRIPPDVDVSGFPNSEIVSRIHADIRVDADAYYIEDLGSSNGTYINNVPLPSGNRHRLRVGDRIALGKGDKVTFLFQA